MIRVAHRPLAAIRAACLAALCWGTPACKHSSAPDSATENAERTFSTVCARCHGSDGKGGVAPEGSNAPRNFCDAAFQAARSDEQLAQVIRGGKGSMPAFGNLFPDADLRALVRKVRSFNPDPKKP